MRPWWSLLLLALVAAVVEGDTSLKVVSWNVRNYLITDRVVDDTYRRSYPKPEVEKEGVREVLRAIDADIVLLQEMGADPFLFELQRDLKAEGLNYAYRAVLTASDEHRHLAVLSRVPFEMQAEAHDLDFKYLEGRAEVKRGLMELAFETEGVDWRLFNLHLKSRYTDFKEDPESARRRTAEALVIRDVLRAELGERAATLFFVAGDFNDEPLSAPLRRFRQVNSQPLLELVPLADDRGDKWTHYFERQDRYTRVDMVLAAPAALPLIVAEESFIFDSSGVRIASDHRPVVWTVKFTTSIPALQNHGTE